MATAVWTELKDWLYGEQLNDDRIINAQFVQNQKYLYEQINHGVRGIDEIGLTEWTAPGTNDLCTVTVTLPRTMDLFTIFLVSMRSIPGQSQASPRLQFDSDADIVFDPLVAGDNAVDFQCTQHLLYTGRFWRAYD